jgi:DNA-binding response OmpR family regulator
VDRTTLLTDVWGLNSGATIHTLVTHISRLRQKVEADPSSPQLLLTDRGAYRLDAAAPSAAGAERTLPRIH